MSQNWFPEIMYEESEDGVSSKIPFVLVPKEEVMPSLIYIFESRETGEHEPGLDGDPVPILEMDLHQYADMKVLKEKLSLELYDQVRECLGLQPLQEAIAAGRGVTSNVRKNIEEKTSNQV
tara:strand:+ start:16641 stop:17003 length:363 start_codon:yes stop_codon:yes gene_type:complete